MIAKNKLDRVYENAHRIEFDNYSKIVFFSDIHRGDDSISDEFGRNKHIYNHALTTYFEEGFTYVELGDGDELWEHSNFEHIRNAHAVSFNRLKKFYDDGRMYMLFGNHNFSLEDPAVVEKMYYRTYDEYELGEIDLFPGITVYEALLFVNKNTGQQIFATHGHQGDLINDSWLKLSYFLVRFLWRFLHIVGVRYAARPVKSRRKRHRLEKKYTKWNQRHNEIIVCGHTHRPRFPKPGEGSYFNTGCCIHPRGITCLELENDCLSLVAWRVHTQADGTMYIKKTLLMGPEPLINYIEEEDENEL